MKKCYYDERNYCDLIYEHVVELEGSVWSVLM